MIAPARWFLLVDGARTGPLGLADVRARVLDGRVTASTWVWADGMPEWRHARLVPALVPPPTLGVDGWTDAPDAPDAPAASEVTGHLDGDVDGDGDGNVDGDGDGNVDGDGDGDGDGDVDGGEGVAATGRRS